MTRKEGIQRVYDGPRHVVILGAGASIAATIHNPEPAGKELPSMENFIDVVGLNDIINKVKDKKNNGNFEVLYSRLYKTDPSSSLITDIEHRVRDYFSNLAFPSTPTIYDYLLLALRNKDLIATFNWDPFLYKAFCRNRNFGGVPHLSFLHGNVAIGYSPEDQKSGPAGRYSKKTGNLFTPTRLLFPVTQKNYNNDEFIAHEWEKLKKWLQNAKRITIFGYGAPDTDVEAVNLMSHAWGPKNQRNLEQIEIIDVQPEDVLIKRWSRFIHTHHYDHYTSYFESSLAQFPRRTGERFMHQFLPSTPEEAFQESNTIPTKFDTLQEMWDWHQPLLEAENQYEISKKRRQAHNKDV